MAPTNAQSALQTQDPWAVVDSKPITPINTLATSTATPATPITAAKPQDQSQTTNDPWAVVENTPTDPTATLKTATQQPQEQSLSSKIGQGIKESFPAQIAAQALVPPQDSTEHLIHSVGESTPGGGNAALFAYRTAKQIVDQAQGMIKAPKQKYEQAKSDFNRLVQDFHNKDYRNLASDLVNAGATGIGLNTAVVPGTEEGIRELSEGARPGGNLATPVTKDIVNAATLAAGEAAPEIAEKAGKLHEDIQSNIENYFHGDADEAAQKGLKPTKRKAVQAQSDLQGARPYLENATDLADLQKKTLAAKDEIWKPYTDTLEKIKDNKVIGPDGSTTIGQLEAERLKTRAELDSWSQLNPTDRQVQLQKEGRIKELNDRYTDITDVLDPEFEKAGLDAKLLRKTWGQVQGVNKLLQGRNTLSEAAQKYGLGKIFNLDLTKPLKNLSNIVEGAKDIVAGRPLFSGKPTDVNIKEGFREGTGGEKPDFTITPKTESIPQNEPQQTEVRQEAEQQQEDKGGNFSGAVNQGATAAKSPEWVKQNFDYEIQRLEGITRDPDATAEEKSVAQSQLDHTREFAEKTLNPQPKDIVEAGGGTFRGMGSNGLVEVTLPRSMTDKLGIPDKFKDFVSVTIPKEQLTPEFVKSEMARKFKEMGGKEEAPAVKTAAKVETSKPTLKTQPAAKTEAPKTRAASVGGVAAGGLSGLTRPESEKSLEAVPEGDQWAVVNQPATKTASSRKEIPDLLDKAAEDYNLPVSLFYAQAQQESRMNQDAVSPKGAKGVMQLMPQTAKDLGVDPDDVEDNIKGGAKLMAQLREHYNGDNEKSLAAYNWSPDKVDAAIKKYGTNWKNHIPSETKHYIKAILAQQEK